MKRCLLCYCSITLGICVCGVHLETGFLSVLKEAIAQGFMQWSLLVWNFCWIATLIRTSFLWMRKRIPKPKTFNKASVLTVFSVPSVTCKTVSRFVIFRFCPSPSLSLKCSHILMWNVLWWVSKVQLISVRAWVKELWKNGISWSLRWLVLAELDVSIVP